MNQSRKSLHTISCCLLLLLPPAAQAHSADRGFILLLPTSYYIVGGALAVIASVAVVSLIRMRSLDRILKWHWNFQLPVWTGQRFGPITVSLLSTLSLVVLVFVGFTGNPDPLANPLPLTIWTLWWVLFTILHALLGNLWAWLNPWSGIAHLCFANREPWFQLPEKWGYWPAIIGIMLFAWFELVSLAPEDPPTLATAVVSYWLINFVALLLFGEQVWLQRGEAFSVFFRFVSLLAPLSLIQTGLGRDKLHICVPGVRLLTFANVHWSGAVFILVTLATVSFDGLSKTFWWLAANGINPLEFGGRSTVMWINSAGLVLAMLVLVALYLFSVWSGWQLAGKSTPLATLISRYAMAIIPISLGYHFAHYLTALLVNGQYALKLFVQPERVVTTSFLSTHHAVEKLWQLQVAAIVVGHVVSVLLAHLISLGQYRTGQQVFFSQLPLALLMVLYTVFGLWLLSTPTGL